MEHIKINREHLLFLLKNFGDITALRESLKLTGIQIPGFRDNDRCPPEILLEKICDLFYHDIIINGWIYYNLDEILNLPKKKIRNFIALKETIKLFQSIYGIYPDMKTMKLKNCMFYARNVFRN